MKLFSFEKCFIKKLNLVIKLVGKPPPTILPIDKVGRQSEVALTWYINDYEILLSHPLNRHHSHKLAIDRRRKVIKDFIVDYKGRSKSIEESSPCPALNDFMDSMGSLASKREGTLTCETELIWVQNFGDGEFDEFEKMDIVICGFKKIDMKYVKGCGHAISPNHISAIFISLSPPSKRGNIKQTTILAGISQSRCKYGIKPSGSGNFGEQNSGHVHGGIQNVAFASDNCLHVFGEFWGSDFCQFFTAPTIDGVDDPQLPGSPSNCKQH
ncbi:hypothetical protein LXL04_021939 [Taraxacum kok-saghyz]